MHIVNTLEHFHKAFKLSESGLFVLRRMAKRKVYPFQIYTACSSKSNRACHPQAIFHLLPTYKNNSESQSKINTNRPNSAHKVAALRRLTSIIPNETGCLYLERSALTARGRRSETMLVFWPSGDNAARAVS